MKKTLALVMLAGLMLTGCGKQASAQSTASPPSASNVAVAATVTVPGVINLTLDKATAKLEDLGLKVKATDAEKGKMILKDSNWQVVSQDPAEGSDVAKGSTVKLGVKHLTDPTPTPTPTPVPTQAVVPAEVVAPAAPPVVVAPPAPAYVPPAPAYVPPAPAYVPPAAPAPVSGTIVCRDGYIWPRSTRQGACSGHGGIRN